MAFEDFSGERSVAVTLDCDNVVEDCIETSISSGWRLILGTADTDAGKTAGFGACDEDFEAGDSGTLPARDIASVRPA